MNAYALSGGAVPVDSTAIIRPQTGAKPGARYIKGLDYYLDELTLLDDQPNAIGSLSADTGPFEARTWITLKQYYAIGDCSIKTGGGFLIAKHFRPDFGLFQVSNRAADNYLSIKRNNPSVTFEAATITLYG